MGILQLNLVPSPSFHFSSNILHSSFKMSVPIEYRDFMTTEPYVSAPMSSLLTFKEYEALAVEQSAVEEKYDEAVNRHEEWKMAKAKEAWAEQLRKEKEAHQLKVEVLRQEKLEAERKAEEWRQEEEWLRLEAKKEKVLALEREKQEAVEHQRLADLKEKEDREKEKEKEKEDEANELVLQAAGALSASDGDAEVDPADLKTAAMAELRRRHKITKRKKKADDPESQKCKV